MTGGLPHAGADFFAELELNNDRDWWAAHNDTYERDVRTPLLRLVDALDPEFRAAKVYRPTTRPLVE